MADSTRQYTDDVPDDVTARVRERCTHLPGAAEEKAWAGHRWRVRGRTFAHVLGVDRPGENPFVALTFRAAGDELDALRHTGHPFFMLGWGRGAVGMVVDSETDWDEVEELLIESFCLLAPKKLVALVDRPDADDES